MWLTLLTKIKPILVAVAGGVKWLWEKVANDRFARTCLVIGLIVIVALGLEVLRLTLENRALKKELANIRPSISTVNGKPVTVIQWRTKIEHSPGWDVYVDPKGNLTTDKFGFRFIPFGGIAYSGEIEPYGGISWFACHKFHLQSGAGKDNVYPIGLSRCLPFISQVTVNFGVKSEWSEWKPGMFGGLSILTR